MGNCCRPASSVDQWGGEDWSSLKSKTNTIRKTSSSSSKVFDEGDQGLSFGNVEKEKLFGELRTSSDENGKVKIKITKKELAELLGAAGIEKQHHDQQHNMNMNMKVHQVVVGRSSTTCAEQVLIRLIKAREHAKQLHHDSHHTPWKPVLHTIPEVD